MESGLDLNEVPQIAPKIEPLDPPSSAAAAAAADAEIPTPLRELPGDEDLFAQYFRLAQSYLNSYNAGAASAAYAGPSSSSAVVAADPGNGSSSSAALVVSKKKKARSGDMVRVSSLSLRDQMYSKDLVRRRRVTFESLRLFLIREEERGDSLGLLARRSRCDLKAAALMTNRELWLNRNQRIIGSIPGINIGDIYFFRMELCVIGLHGQVQAGIDYVSASRTSSGEPIATSIIVSGGYEDDDDNGYELIYTGQGGRDPNMHKHCQGQTLGRGNLALERSLNYGVEIRVIRGIKCDKSPTSKVYVYDGLYRVVKYWEEVGRSGFPVLKYKLVRIEGQEEMGSMMIRRAEELKANPLSVRPTGYLSLDMSMGKERVPVALFNDIDEDGDPLLFDYVAQPVYPSGLRDKVFGDWGCGCQCVSECNVDCYCAKMNGGEIPYDRNGILLRGRPVVYECGSSCRCPLTCPNRVSQRGLRTRLEVFRSQETGWGVRSLELIRAGSFICEFSGIVLTKLQAEELSANGEYLVSPNRFPGRWTEWGDISDVFPSCLPPHLPSLPPPGFSLDVSRARNVACYMSHSFSPNVFVQFVLFDHYNVSYPHIMIFALENIPPLRELSIDYGMVDEWVGKLTM